MAKSWSEKFHNGKEPVVAPSIRKISGFPRGTLMLIPTPAQVDEYIRGIPKGESRTQADMSQSLAKASGAEITCPMCCGIFLRICSEKAYEELQRGADLATITPFWRILPPGANTRKKLSFDFGFVDAQRAAEGVGS